MTHFLIEPADLMKWRPQQIHEFRDASAVEAFLIEKLEEEYDFDFSDWVLIKGEEVSFRAKTHTTIDTYVFQ